MKRNWSNLPNSYFLGKFVSIGLPYMDHRLGWLDEFIWLKVTETWASWLIGTVDSDPRLRIDTKRGDVIYFDKDRISKVLGGGE